MLAQLSYALHSVMPHVISVDRFIRLYIDDGFPFARSSIDDALAIEPSRLSSAITLLAGNTQSTTNLPDGMRDLAAAVELIHLGVSHHDTVVNAGEPSPTNLDPTMANTVAILMGDYFLAKASILAAQLGPDVMHELAAAMERRCQARIAPPIACSRQVGSRAEIDPFGQLSPAIIGSGCALAAARAGFERSAEAWRDLGLTFAALTNLTAPTEQNSTAAETLGRDVNERTSPSAPGPAVRHALVNELVTNARRAASSLENTVHTQVVRMVIESFAGLSPDVRASRSDT